MYATRGPWNHLLLKDDVGHPKPTTRYLPYEHFTYGKPEIKDLEDAGQGKSFLQINNAVIFNNTYCCCYSFDKLVIA